ncbi:hypothetical protein P9E34_19685 [Schinkia azotoformans]|uniref:hypothetical protein n=1 Tax=Schinkia azotoformans TaxID=1454 RepID=UPI002DB9F8F3|nr:hypothetical protein [Schinkia azotoformans]MEC1726934.1 hypothetical protein [Schinkia azotoformans]
MDWKEYYVRSNENNLIGEEIKDEVISILEDFINELKEYSGVSENIKKREYGNIFDLPDCTIEVKFEGNMFSIEKIQNGQKKLIAYFTPKMTMYEVVIRNRGDEIFDTRTILSLDNGNIEDILKILITEQPF